MKKPILTWALAALALAGTVYLASERDFPNSISGDEQSYVAMAASLAIDHDLTFDEVDLDRLRAGSGDDRRPLILQRVGGRIAYSKPPVYPLLAAPFYRLFGREGLILLNALLLAAALLAAAKHLAPLGTRNEVVLSLCTFSAAGVLLAQVGWRMGDVAQGAFTLAGLALAVGEAEKRGMEPPASRLGIAAPLVGGGLLGLATAMRLPNGLLAVAVVGGLFLSASHRRALKVAAGFLGLLLIALFLSHGLTGAALPYKAERASFTLQSGYPTQAEGDAALVQFKTERATSSLSVRPRFLPGVSGYSALYFLVGRHTGMLVYFPAALIFALAGLRSADRLRAAILIGVAGVILFYLVWMPRNYFGGAAFLGNRYFLAAYCALPVALSRLPRFRWQAVSWLIGLAAFASAALSVARVDAGEAGSQSHAHAGIFRLLPYESTARAIVGRQDRYWSDGFLRFVDPYVRVADWKFVVESGAPATEVLLAADPAQPMMRFWVYAEDPEGTLEVSQGRRRNSFQLGESGAPGRVIELDAAPAWRRHAFWWDEGQVYAVRSLRFAYRSRSGQETLAKIRYLGTSGSPRGELRAAAESLVVPLEGVAGSVSTMDLRIRNTSDAVWSSNSVFPVYLSYRFYSRDGERVVVEGERVGLAEEVGAGEHLDAQLRLGWPAAPGEYLLVVDLLMEEVAWFADQMGSPLAESLVRVLPVPGAPSPVLEEATAGP